jgi:hypothetical protein
MPSLWDTELPTRQLRIVSVTVVIPDSAVAADAMSKEQTFHSERSLSLRLIRLLAEMGICL